MFESLTDSTVLFWSGGLRSTLLLAMLRDANVKFDIVQHRDLWTKEQKKRPDVLIQKWGLKLFSYPPATVSLVDGISVVSEYAVAGSLIPIVTKVTEGTKCINRLNGLRMEQPPLIWDTCLVGAQVGNTRFYAPLGDWAIEDVERELATREIDVTDTGTFATCHNCLKNEERVWCPAEGIYIDSIAWPKEANLAAFQTAYGIKPLNTH